MNYVTSVNQFSADLYRALKYLLKNGQPAEGGTKIHVVGFMGLMQLFTLDHLVNNKVAAHGKQVSCKNLVDNLNPDLSEQEKAFLEKTPEAQVFFQHFPRSPSLMCPSVFSKNIDFEDGQRSKLANRVVSYRKATADMVKKFQELVKAKSKAIEVSYLQSTTKIVFQAEDVAQDCFHLSASGQNRVAQTVLGELQGH